MQHLLSKLTICNLNFYKFVFLVLLFFSDLSIAEKIANDQTYMVVDSFGKHYFIEPPKRVVVTDWTLLEQLLDLDIIPIGAPEIEQYKKYSPFSNLPQTIKDIGLRQSPSLAVISALKPDLIILGTDQKNLSRPLSRITKVLYYQNFSSRFNSNGEIVLKRNKQISEIFKKQSLSDKLVTNLKNKLNKYKDSLQKHFGYDMPSVIVARRFSDGNMIAYSPHSIIGWGVEYLGLKNLVISKETKFGEQNITRQEIHNSSPDYLFCYGVCSNQIVDVNNSNTQLIQLKENWPYGSISTIQVLAENIVKKLTSR